MKSSDQPRASEHESIEARAAAWLAERDDGLTIEQEQEFSEWKAADRRHAAAVARLEIAWGALHQLREFRPEARQHPDPDLLAPAVHNNVVRFPWRPVLAIAAAAAIAVTALFVWEQRVPVETLPTRLVVTAADHYATTVGGYQRATLPDGSVIELNENSELNLAYTDAVRRVQLVRGEVHFTVAKNKERPFLVEANGVTARAVGTAFNVRIDSDAVEVLVTEGTVEIGGSMQKAETLPLMTAGDQAIVSLDHTGRLPHFEKLSADVISARLSWQGSRLVFVDNPLSEVVAKFNEHNRVQIRIADPKLASFKVAGNFQAENVEAFLRLMASDRDIRVVRPSADLVILEQAR